MSILINNSPVVDLDQLPGVSIELDPIDGSSTITLDSDLNIDGTLALTGDELEVGSQGPAQMAITAETVTLDADITFDLHRSLAGVDYDQLQVRGEVQLAEQDLTLSFGFTPSVGDTFTVIDNDGTDAVIGQFAGLMEGSTLEVNDVALRLSYQGGDGNDVTLTAIAQHRGTAGRDKILGTSASEVITGGLSRDDLYGGGGHDSFVYHNYRDRVDYIRDFATYDQTHESDKIDLRPLFSNLGIVTTDPIADGYVRVIDGARNADLIQLDIDGPLGSSRFRTFIQVANPNANFAQLNHAHNFLTTNGGEVLHSELPTPANSLGLSAF